MSVLKIELTEQHLQLLKALKWSINDKGFILAAEEDDIAPFGENNKYEAIDLILNGIPKDFDPFNTSEFPEYSDEQKEGWDKLYNELPLALEVILYTKTFQVGTYKCKFHERLWEKIK